MINELAKMELLRGASTETLTQIAAHAVVRQLSPGEILLSPSFRNEHVYLLLSGTMTIHFGSVSTDPIRLLEAGASVGEMSVIDGGLPSAYVVANEACRLVALHCDLIQTFAACGNPMAWNLLQILTRWIRGNTERIVADQSRISELSDDANVDSLTGVHNRRWLDHTLDRLLSSTRKEGQVMCILLLDIDHFKKYNDNHGHLDGDRVLKAMGSILKTTLRTYEYAARYGGEEFVVMLPNTTLTTGLTVAERIRQAIATTPIKGQDGDLLPGVTASIGAASSDCATSVEQLLRSADAQLYNAKRSGRNCVYPKEPSA